MRLPERAQYNDGAADAGSLPLRGFRFSGDPGLADVSLVQVVLVNRQGRRWVVVMDPSRAMTGVVIPPPAAGFADRTLLDGVGTTRSALRVQTLRLASGGTPLSFAELVQWNETNLDRALDFTTGFASMDYP